MALKKLGTDLWKSMPDSAEKYQAYLCSREWSERRNAVYKRCKCVCERCGINASDHVHHLTYARKYQELPEDLQALCRQCHEYTHGKSDFDPRCERFLDDDPVDLVCPVCGCQDCHIEMPSWDMETEFGNQGHVVIPMWCECSHEWDVEYFGHKGRARSAITNKRDTERSR